jgi:hypothetical protein
MNFFQRFCCFVLIASLCYSLCFQQQNNDVWGEVKSTVDNYTAISNMVLIVGIPDQPEFFVYSKGLELSPNTKTDSLHELFFSHNIDDTSFH